MAKLTESYLKSMIKQVLNEVEMYTPSGSPRTTEDSIEDALSRALRFLQDASLDAGPEAKQDIDGAIEEIMHAQEMIAQGLGGGLAESRKSRTAPKRK